MSIKSRRLFAILVITAMVLAMLPVTAFAATNNTWSASASVVEVNKTSARIGDGATDGVVFTVGIKEGGDLLTGTAIEGIYIKSSRDAEEAEVSADYFSTTSAAITYSGSEMASSLGAPLQADSNWVETDATGIFEVRVKSTLPGSATISFYKNVAGKDPDESILVGQKTITFTAGAATVSDVDLTIDDDDATPGDYTAEVGTKLTLRAQITPSVSGKTVTFQKSYDSGTWQTIGEATTNSLGRASVTVSETAGGAYQFRAKCEGKTDVKDFTYEGLDAVTITNVTENNTVVAVGENSRIYFNMKDAFGNNILDITQIKYFQKVRRTFYKVRAGKIALNTNITINYHFSSLKT